MGNPEQPEDAEVTQEDGASTASGSKSRVRSIVTFSISMLLLVGAAYFVYKGTNGLEGVWDSIRAAPWWMIVLIVIGPMGNHLSVSMCLQALQSRHGKVGVREMFVLVGSAWLFNYLPMRPGLIGRIGYHKSINKIRLRDSLESSIWSGVLAGIANCVILLLAIVMVRVPAIWSIVLPFVPVVLMFACSPMMPGRKSRLLMKALAFRQIDVIVWLGRYWLAFQVLGMDIGIGDIAIISAVSQLASLMPLTGSGIGFREWGVGLTASASGHTMSTAIAADLINRAAETLIVVPVGLVCTAMVARHWKGKRDLSQLDLSEDDACSDSDQEDTSGDSAQQNPAVQREL
jgi:uncharacterized membrane protein YbhN (UPF0104 family)